MQSMFIILPAILSIHFKVFLPPWEARQCLLVQVHHPVLSLFSFLPSLLRADPLGPLDDQIRLRLPDRFFLVLVVHDLKLWRRGAYLALVDTREHTGVHVRFVSLLGVLSVDDNFHGVREHGFDEALGDFLESHFRREVLWSSPLPGSS